MMQMMEAQGQAPGGMDMQKMAKDNTLELNAAHPLVVNLNQVRKHNKKAAGLVARQLLDNVMVQSGIPFNLQTGTDRQYELLGNYLDLQIDEAPTTAQRKSGEPILKQA